MSPFLQFGQKRHLSGTIAGETIKKIKLNHYAQKYRICREFKRLKFCGLMITAKVLLNICTPLQNSKNE